MNPDQLIAQFGEQQVAGFLLVLGRISPLFILAPLFSSKLMPARAKSVVAVALAVGIAPIAMRGVGGEAGRLPLELIDLAGLMFKEILVGTAFAFAFGAFFAAVAVAGNLLDTLVGFGFGALVDPVTGNAGGAINQLYALVGVAIFIAIGGDAWVIQGLARTYDAVPLLSAPEIGSLVEGVQVAFSGIFGAALQVCAPVLLAIVLTDVAFGLVSRVVPQLNVFAVGFPAKVTVGLVLIAASLPFLGGWLDDELQRSVGSALQALKVSG
ncbi:MAG: flagellar biosynthetic protein FliR [Solirubrobacteraceae bacterium]